MSQKTFSIDTSVLPVDALSFYDDKFYKMVEAVAGTAEAKLLEVQGIRSVYSFLNIQDVFEILSIPCSALTHIKRSICLQADDDTYMVKPGCRSSLTYLHQLLYKKNKEHVKELMYRAKKNKNQKFNLSQSSAVSESMNCDTFDDQTPTG